MTPLKYYQNLVLLHMLITIVFLTKKISRKMKALQVMNFSRSAMVSQKITFNSDNSNRMT